jgi:hypothetical protein
MWITVFDTAARSGQSLIFTFAPEPTVSAGFVGRVRTVVESGGGAVKFVQLAVSHEEQEKRLGVESRREFRKLMSLDLLRALRADFAASEGVMPAADLVIDTESVSPEIAAQRIAAAFELPAASTVE